ncbi:hypothetical protein GIY23_21745 [Allosaccharopolyspora coralli]|uniref:ESX-1 secretion-associated protein n=1 Tax=Allosaccharopolyspora coralli TaxID=2665642 RepID=A0A5Q3QK20_9PSEU|nr:hypothetical protein [Allosaccharopolyspora coralli]QGK71789.1 hypothetical protein GIY23_21745 [Allosaccharopolyspora coralli]
MTQAGYNMGALEDCRSTVDSKAGPAGAVGDGFEAGPVDVAVFGELDAAGRMAAAVASLDEAGKREFDKAEQVLRSASGALDAVRTSVEATDDEARRSFH